MNVEKDLKIEPKWAEKIDTIAGILSHNAELVIYWNDLANSQFSGRTFSSYVEIQTIDREIRHYASLYLSNIDIHIPSLTNIFLESFAGYSANNPGRWLEQQ